MAGWNRPIRAAAVAFGLTAHLLYPSSGRTAEIPSPRGVPSESAGLRSEAESAEQAGSWEKALDGYLRLYLTAGPSAEVRDKIRLCFRHTAQFRRHRDPAFQQFVLSLPAADALAIYAEVVTKLNTLYVERDRATPTKLFHMGLEELDRALGDAEFRSRHTGTADETPKLQAFRTLLRTEWKARQPVAAKDVRQAARELVVAAHDRAGIRDASAVVLELLCGACGGLDEYTTYVTPTAEQAELASPIAEFANYGLLVRIDAGELVIDDVVPNSWAALNTRVRKGQRIVGVNGRPTLPTNPTLLAEAVRAGMAFEHVLELDTGSGGSVLLDPVQLPVPAPTVFGPPELFKGGVGYLRLSAFRETTLLELGDKVLDLRARGMRALVLDVRGNPGGLFTSAVAVAQRFLPTGVVVSTQGQTAEFANRVFVSDAGPSAWEFPVVLLVDTRTMSAAEVLAAALKDHARATLIGLPTFGKGVVQSPVRLQPTDVGDGKGGVLILTVATVSGPQGAMLNASVSPHVLEADPTRQLEAAILKASDLLQSAR